MRRRTALTTVAIVLALSLPGSTLALGTLDQSQTQHGATDALFSLTVVRPFGQTFTAGRTGLLDTVALLPLESYEGAALQVRTVDGGLPTSTVLASQTFTSSETESLVATVFSAPAAVTEGTQYAIVVVPPSTGFYLIAKSAGDAYAGGSAVAVGTDGATWSAQNNDMVFETYVTAGTTDGDGPNCDGLADATARAGSGTSAGSGRARTALEAAMAKRGCAP
jgi:hypothetical protein